MIDLGYLFFMYTHETLDVSRKCLISWLILRLEKQNSILLISNNYNLNNQI
jgi:hypothetical protein